MSTVDLRPTDSGPPPSGPDAGPPDPAKSARRSLVELGLVIAVVVGLAVATGQVALLVFVVCLIVMIMVHELGHFLAAKRGHMKVTEYFLGSDPGSGRSAEGRPSTG